MDQNLMYENKRTLAKIKLQFQLRKLVAPVRSALLSQLTSCLGPQKPMRVARGAMTLPANSMMILTTDGLHDFISLADLTFIIGDNCQSLSTGCSQLIAKAVANGSQDNISVVIFAMKKE